MKKIIAVLVAALFLALVALAHAAPVSNIFRNLLPEVNDTYDLGSTTPAAEWNNLFAKNINVSGTCTGCGSASPGGASSSIQYNKNGVFGGNTGLTYDGTNGIIRGNYLIGTANTWDTSTGNLLIPNIGTTTIVNNEFAPEYPIPMFDSNGQITTDPSYLYYDKTNHILFVNASDQPTANNATALEVFHDSDITEPQGNNDIGYPVLSLSTYRGTYLTNTPNFNGDTLGQLRYYGVVGATTSPSFNGLVALQGNVRGASTTNPGGAFSILTWPDAGNALVPRVSVDQNGNVGISSSTPASPFTVAVRPVGTMAAVLIGTSTMNQQSGIAGNANGTMLGIFGPQGFSGDLVDMQQWQSSGIPGQSIFEVNGSSNSGFAVHVQGNTGFNTTAPDAVVSINGSADVFPGFFAGGQNFTTSNSHGAATVGKYFYTVTDQSTYADSLSAYTFQKSSVNIDAGDSATNPDLTSTTTKSLAARPDQVFILSVSSSTNRILTYDVSDPTLPVLTNTFTDNTNMVSPTQIFTSGMYLFVNNAANQSITTYNIGTSTLAFVSKVDYQSGFSVPQASSCDLANQYIYCANERSSSGRFNIAILGIANPQNVIVLGSLFSSNHLTAGTNLTSISAINGQVSVVDPLNGISNWLIPSPSSGSVTFTAKSGVGGSSGYTAPSIIVNKGYFSYVIDGTKAFVTKGTTLPGASSPAYAILATTNTQSAGTCVLTSLVLNDGFGFGSCALGNWQATLQGMTVGNLNAGDTDIATLAVNKDSQLLGNVQVGNGLTVAGSTHLQNNVTIGNLNQASTTLTFTGKLQMQGLNTAGAIICSFFVGTTLTTNLGTCTN